MSTRQAIAPVGRAGAAGTAFWPPRFAWFAAFFAAFAAFSAACRRAN